MYWASGTAHLLPQLIRGREAGPVFLSERRPGPARRPKAEDLCPHTGRARLGYDRARVLLDHYTSPGQDRPAGTCTSYATPRPPTSARPTPASN